MQIQTVFKAGNSYVVTIPKNLLKEMNIKIGQKVAIEKLSDSDAILVKKLSKQTPKKATTSKDFKKWWNEFIKENGEILDELAVR